MLTFTHYLRDPEYPKNQACYSKGKNCAEIQDHRKRLPRLQSRAMNLY